MDKFVSVIRDYMHAEADAGYPLLRQIPSTRATACFDYLERISPAEREELLDAHAWVSGTPNVTTTITVKAIACKTAGQPSSVASAAYTITGATAPPMPTPIPGTYTSARTKWPNSCPTLKPRY